MALKNHVYRGEDFFRLLDFEIKRARRYQNFFSVMRFALQGDGGSEESSQEERLKYLLNLVREEIRETDLIGQTTRNEIMIILPYCDPAGAKVVNTRLNRLVNDFHFDEEGLQVRSGLTIFPVQANNMTEILDSLNMAPKDTAPTGMN
jgi:hypothetical protein